MVKKEQGQDDYFSQQSTLLTLPTYISALVIPTKLFISLKCLHQWYCGCSQLINCIHVLNSHKFFYMSALLSTKMLAVPSRMLE